MLLQCVDHCHASCLCAGHDLCSKSTWRDCWQCGAVEGHDWVRPVVSNPLKAKHLQCCYYVHLLHSVYLLHVNCGPSTHHTLRTSDRVWQSLLSNLPNAEDPFLKELVRECFACSMYVPDLPTMQLYCIIYVLVSVLQSFRDLTCMHILSCIHWHWYGMCLKWPF